MTRLSSAELASYTQGLRNRFGELQASASGGQLTVAPPGQMAPSGPGTTPTRSVGRSRNFLGLLEPVLDVACSLYNPNPGGFIDRYLDFSEYTNSVSVADALLRGVCDQPPGTPQPAGAPVNRPLPPSSPPYDGGQCVCDRYNVTVFVSSQSTNSGVDSSVGPIRGPIRDIGVFYQTNSQGEPRAGGPTVTYGDPTCGGIRTDQLSGVPAFERDVQISNIRITNLDNPGDDCGSLPGGPDTDPTSPTPQPLPPITFDPGDGGPPVNIAPRLGIEIGQGGPQLNVDFGPINVGVDIGGVNINFPDSPSNCCPPNARDPQPEDVQPDPSTPVQPPPPDVPDEPGPDEEEERVIRAVVVTSTNYDGPATVLTAADGSPALYVPRLASLQFKVIAGNGVSGWTRDIDIKNAQQYIEVPAQQGAVDVRATPFGNASIEITRLYQPLDSEIEVPTT